MKIARWGNSLAVRIPKDVAEALGLNEGDEVKIAAGAPGTLDISRKHGRKDAIRSLRAFRGRLPDDYRFDRDEANAR